MNSQVQQVPQAVGGRNGERPGDLRQESFLRISNLTVSYQLHLAVKNLSIALAQGEKLCLLGPSGCGKTTCLRSIAGFLTPAAGEIFIGGRSMKGLNPELRNVGILFQNYALFPHLTVWDNVAFGLRMRKLPKDEIETRVQKALELVKLAAAANRMPSMLSGGEQQRIAFARAVVIEPTLLLLDEPFSNLDAKLRKTMQRELNELLDRLGISTLLVTHDQEEAMTMADRIAVMRAGRIEQIGTPSEIYDHPVNEFVATFIGGINTLTGEARRSNGKTRVDLPALGAVGVAHGGDATGPVKVMVRPERMRLRSPGEAGTGTEAGGFEGTVAQVTYTGSRREYEVSVAQFMVSVSMAAGQGREFVKGERVVISWDTNASLVFPGETA